MARVFAFFALFHLSLPFFRPEVPFDTKLGKNKTLKSQARVT